MFYIGLFKTKASLYEDIISITPIEHYPLLKLCVKDGYDEDKIMEFLDTIFLLVIGFTYHLKGTVIILMSFTNKKKRK